MCNRECPCRHCVPPKRSITCHSSCDEYTEWKTMHEAKNAKIKEAKHEYEEFFISKLKRKSRIR